MNLRTLVKNIPITQVIGSDNVEVSMLSQDTRESFERGTLYCAVRGTQVDGHDFIDEAIEKGAQSILCSTLPQRVQDEVTYLVCEDVSPWIGVIASQFFGNPSRSLQVIGVTGTNGKTSVVTMLYQTLTLLNERVALLGTIENRIADKVFQAQKTTLSPIELHAFFRKAVDDGCRYLCMEVSSHALDQKRVAGIDFDMAIFTNLSQDHLDYHHTMEEYACTKKKLFDRLGQDKQAIINADDSWSSCMIQECKAKVKEYGSSKKVDYHLVIDSVTRKGTAFSVNEKSIMMSHIGRYNSYNATAVFAALCEYDFDAKDIISALEQVPQAQGRLEIIPSPQDTLCVVDYAHTPDALKNVLETLHSLPHNRIITIFGCGGDRDKTKRPLMAAIAEALSDIIIVTNDNPRTEDPDKIFHDIEAGFQKSSTGHAVIPDREKAIHRALKTMKEKDILLVAGKGHETYQIIGTTKRDFDDREVITSFFKRH